MWALWWVWMIAGLVLAGFEALIPGWLFLGFALGALATGLMLLAGGPLSAWLAGSAGLTVLTWAVLSVLSWWGLRRWAGVRKGQVRIWNRDINDD